MNSFQLSDRFQQAFDFAMELHAGQTRKQSEVPYIAHLLGVAALVLEDGGDEDQAIAALLHDGPEDQGGQETLDEIKAQFGPRVAQIVEDCSDTFETPKPDWRTRKEDHLARVKDFGPETCRVMLADKLYNARSLVNDLLREGEAAWEKFKGKKEGTLWYYRQMHARLSEKLPGGLADQLGRTIAEIEGLSG